MSIKIAISLLADAAELSFALCLIKGLQLNQND